MFYSPCSDCLGCDFFGSCFISGSIQPYRTQSYYCWCNEVCKFFNSWHILSSYIVDLDWILWLYRHCFILLTDRPFHSKMLNIRTLQLILKWAYIFQSILNSPVKLIKVAFLSAWCGQGISRLWRNSLDQRRTRNEQQSGFTGSGVN